MELVWEQPKFSFSAHCSEVYAIDSYAIRTEVAREPTGHSDYASLAGEVVREVWHA